LPHYNQHYNKKTKKLHNYKIRKYI